MVLKMNCTKIYNFGEFNFILVATMASSWLLVIIFGLLINSLVLVAVVKSRLLRQHTATNVFIISLCSTHLVICGFLPVNIYMMFCRYPIWLQCQFEGLGMLSAIGTSMFNIGAIAVSRLLLVTRPEHYKTIFTRSKMASILICIWVLPLVSACVIPEIKESLFISSNGTCASQTLTPYYYRMLAVLYYPIPYLAIVLSYGLIYRHIRCHFNQKETHMSPASNTNLSAIQKRKLKVEKNEIITNIFLPVLATFIFSLPLCATLAIGNTENLKLGITIYLCNICVSPMVYGFKNPQLKTAIWTLLNCRCPVKTMGPNSTTVNMSNFSRDRNLEIASP